MHTLGRGLHKYFLKCPVHSHLQAHSTNRVKHWEKKEEPFFHWKWSLFSAFEAPFWPLLQKNGSSLQKGAVFQNGSSEAHFWLHFFFWVRPIQHIFRVYTCLYSVSQWAEPHDYTQTVWRFQPKLSNQLIHNHDNMNISTAFWCRMSINLLL